MKAVSDLVDAKKIAVDILNIASPGEIQAVLGATEKLGQPVTPQFAPVHESIIPLKVIGPMMVMAAERPSAPICVHLGHDDKLETPRGALETSFTSVMYDGSVLPFEEDAANTRIAVKMTGDWDVSMKAEIGTTGGQEFSSVGEGEKGEAVGSCYTDPEQARAFAELTGIDTLAYSFDTVHELYLTTSKLGFNKIRRTWGNVGIPIVMRDRSEVSDGSFKRHVVNGVRGVNYCAYLAKAGGIYAKEKCRTTEEYVFSRNVTQWAIRAMKEDVLHAIKVFFHLE